MVHSADAFGGRVLTRTGPSERHQSRARNLTRLESKCFWPSRSVGAHRLTDHVPAVPRASSTRGLES